MGGSWGRWLGVAALMFGSYACDDGETGGDAPCPEGTVRSGNTCVPDPIGGTDGGGGVGGGAGGMGGMGDAGTPDAGPGDLTLPLIVDDYYAPSGFMGDGETGGIVADNDCPERAGEEGGLCHRFAYTAADRGFGGVFWQYPDGNWGDAPGLAVPAGATRLQFYAWGAEGGEQVRFVMGYGETDGFAVESEFAALTDTPTLITLDLAGVPYDEIAGGLAWFAEAGATFYMDDIRIVADAADTVDPCTVSCATLQGLGECEGKIGYGACKAQCADRRAGDCSAEADAWLTCVDDGGWVCNAGNAAPMNGCAAERDLLVACEGDAPAAPLPFYIEEHFTMSGYMGGGEVESAPCDADEGDGGCLRITWTPGDAEWVGFFFQYPENNWGELPGLSIADGATHIRYRAWGAEGGERANFASGIADVDSFNVESGYMALGTEPTEGVLTIPPGVDEVTGGFAWFLEANGAESVTFYLDDVQWRDDMPPGGARGCTDAAASNHNPAADVDDGSCAYPVEFSVDMNCTADPFETVFITGPFCEWCADGFELLDADGDGVYTGSFDFPMGPLEFKFMVDSFNGQEDLIDDVAAGTGACAPVTDGATFANRQVDIIGAQTIEGTYGQCQACGEDPPPPAGDFETITFDDANTAYALVGFGGAEDSAVVADPTDAGNMVARIIKNDAAELWAGVTMATRANDAAGRIGFDAENVRMTVRVWSPDAGIQVRLKTENALDPTISVETEATTTVANAWEELTFDFTQQAAGTAAINFAATYDKVSIFLNFGVTGAVVGAKTYYVDDVTFIGGLGEVIPPPVGGDFETITFDDAELAYALTGFGGAEDSAVVVDPTDDGNMVARITKNDAAELWAGVTMSTQANEAVGRINFDAENVRMTVRVWSPDAGIQVRLKVENALDPTVSVETEATSTVANAWEELTFDFSQQADGTAAINFAATYDKVSIFLNFGVTGAEVGAKTYYVDDVTFIGGVGEVIPPPAGDDFETITFDDAELAYALTGFGGAEDSAVVVDPTDDGNMVARITKNDAAELWAGVTMSTQANEAVGRIGFDAENVRMTVRVWSPDAGIQVRLKVENALDPTVSVETEATTTVANDWEELTFDFSQQADGTAAINFAATYDKVSIFLNFGVTGAEVGAKTYYVDDVTFIGGVGEVIPPPAGDDFETITFDDAELAYALTGFGGAEDSAVVVDPTDDGNMVARITKNDAAELWAGVTMSTQANEAVGRIGFDAANVRMTVRVWSPDAGIQVRLKVENALDPTVSVETEATTTVANDWEELTFDFTQQADGTAAINFASTYDKVSIFLNFGVTGAEVGAKTYYVDDVTFIGGVGEVIPPPAGDDFETITFDDAELAYALTGFGGAEDSAVVVDPTDDGNMVARITKNDAAELWAGVTMSTQANEAVGRIGFDAANVRMTVRVWSPDAGIQVRLKVENALDPTVSVETEATTTVANDWEELTFDFTQQADGTAAINFASTYDKVSIFLNFGVTGAEVGAKTYYVDDVTFIGGVGEVIPPPAGDDFETITFDDAELEYTLTGFGGAEDSAVVVDPTDDANMVARITKNDAAQVWAGVTMATRPNAAAGRLPFDAENVQMTVRVWSPDAGIQVRLKVENAMNAGVSVETEATTTVANDWEELTFDFTQQADGTAAINFAETYDKVSIFLNFGVDGAAVGEKTYYVDDVAFIGGLGSGEVLPMGGFDEVTFDDADVEYALIGFGGADGVLVDDPENEGNTVARITKNDMAQLWAGVTIGTQVNDSVGRIPLDAENPRMSVVVWSPDAGIQVRLKVEDATDPTISVETEATTTVGNGWEELVFDFSQEAPGTAAVNYGSTYDRASIFFNFGVEGAAVGEKTYYLDNVKHIDGVGEIMPPVGGFETVTFDDELQYALIGFGGAEDAVLVEDPTDAGNMVARVIKNDMAQLWAGVTFATLENDAVGPIPFDAQNVRMSVMVWSPDAGIQVRLKVENALNAGVSVETEATTTVANGWEELVFDFSQQADGTAAIDYAATYDKASIFFNFGITGAEVGAKTYYFDDVTFIGGVND